MYTRATIAGCLKIDMLPEDERRRVIEQLDRQEEASRQESYTYPKDKDGKRI